MPLPEDMSDGSVQPIALPNLGSPTDSPTSTSQDSVNDPSSAPGDTDFGWSQDQMGETPYTQYQIDSKYIINNGLLQAPVAGPPGTPCEMIQVCSPYGQRVIKWTCKRIGSKPTMPYPATGNANEVFSGGAAQMCSPGYSPNGKQVWTAQGVYTFRLLNPAVFGTDTLKTGAIPARTEPGALVGYEGNLFDRSLLTS